MERVECHVLPVKIHHVYRSAVLKRGELVIRGYITRRPFADHIFNYLLRRPVDYVVSHLSNQPHSRPYIFGKDMDHTTYYSMISKINKDGVILWSREYSRKEIMSVMDMNIDDKGQIIMLDKCGVGRAVLSPVGDVLPVRSGMSSSRWSNEDNCYSGSNVWCEKGGHYFVGESDRRKWIICKYDKRDILEWVDRAEVEPQYSLSKIDAGLLDNVGGLVVCGHVDNSVIDKKRNGREGVKMHVMARKYSVGGILEWEYTDKDLINNVDSGDADQNFTMDSTGNLYICSPVQSLNAKVIKWQIIKLNSDGRLIYKKGSSP